MRKSMQYVKDNNGRNPEELLDLTREILRRKHYSIRTEAAHVGNKSIDDNTDLW